MNDRIRELARHAGIKITPMVLDGVEYEYEDVNMDGSEDLAKFAELIIKECINKTFDSEKGIGTTRWKTEVMAELKEHFGIES